MCLIVLIETCSPPGNVALFIILRFPCAVSDQEVELYILQCPQGNKLL